MLIGGGGGGGLLYHTDVSNNDSSVIQTMSSGIHITDLCLCLAWGLDHCH